jgi:hypothetical protein
MLDPDVIEKLVSHCQNVSHISHFELFYEYTETTISKGIFGINRKRRPIIDISQIQSGRVRLGLFFSDQTHTSFSWNEDEVSLDFCMGQISKASSQKRQKVSHSRFAVQIDDGHFIEVFDPRQNMMSEQMRQSILNFNLDIIHGISKAISFRDLEFEDSVINRDFWTKNKHFSEKSTMYTIRHTLQLPHSEIPQIKSENNSRYFSDLASIPLNAVLVRKLLQTKEVEIDIQEADYLVLEPRVISQIVRTLLPCFSLEHIKNKTSFLHDKIGQSIANRYVHISDDPLMMCGVNSRVFDVSGRSSQPRVLLQDGKVNDFYSNSLEQSTGHLNWDEQIFFGNIMVKSGRRSLNMIFDEGIKALIGECIVGKIDFDQKTGEISFCLCLMLREGNDQNSYAGLVRLKGNVLDILSSVVEATNQSERFGFIDSSGWVLNKDIFSSLKMM